MSINRPVSPFNVSTSSVLPKTVGVNEGKAIEALNGIVAGRPPPSPTSIMVSRSPENLPESFSEVKEVNLPVLTTRDSMEGFSPRSSSSRDSPVPFGAFFGRTSSEESSFARQTFVNVFSAVGKEPDTVSAKAISRAEFYSFDKINLPKIALTETQEKSLGASIDQGGHGGTLKGALEIDGNSHEVFLKPFDGVEAKNYELIQKNSPDLAKFMPTVHGLATDTKGRQFLIMENTRVGSDQKELKQYGDIKIAGKVEGLKGKNLICDQEEMMATRGRAKGRGDYKQMEIGANKAPGFMFYKDSSLLGKLGRIFNFKNSKSNLHDKLKEAKPTSQVIRNLVNDLSKLQSALSKSGVVLIGGSIIIVEDGKGGLKPKLIDPAHVQYDPSQKDKFGNSEGIYYGGADVFKDRRESNKIGITNLIQAIADYPISGSTASTL